MNGIRITFDATGPRFNFSTAITGFDSTVQNALVNVGTSAGQDRVYPDRGTDLARDAARGAMIDQVSANHTANFAALRTLSFSQKTEAETSPSKLQSFNLRSTAIENQRAMLAVQAISSNGVVRGALAIV